MRLINRSDVLAQMPRHRAAESPRDPLQMPAVPPTGREHERALVHAWREAHWAFRLKLEELARRFGITDLAPLYDEARRRDNQLNELYRTRAEQLERARREPIKGGVAGRAGECTLAERALLARFRVLGQEDRAALLRLAARLGQPPRATPAGLRDRAPASDGRTGDW